MDPVAEFSEHHSHHEPGRGDIRGVRHVIRAGPGADPGRGVSLGFGVACGRASARAITRLTW